ncbi:ADP/ATP carrier receptor [Cytidiella melzeri]|nr:ADP/ATP carrier receptor [Cytidiella melzeri]
MSTSATSQNVIERVQNWVSDNKQVVIVGAVVATAAIGGAAYYASSSRGGDGGKGERKKDKKKASKTSSKKKKASSESDGPILEQVSPTVADEVDELALLAEDIAVMPAEERTKVAGSLKTKGNSAYSKKHYPKAVEYYTKAIEISPKPEPTYFSNRAACYMNMDSPQYEKVVEDCNAALALDKKYIKALNRRATALEALERYEESSRDFTAVTILEKFANEASSAAVERVLKKLAAQKAQIILATREPRIPGHSFTTAYFGAFRDRPLPVLPVNPTTGDNTLILALNALKAQSYIHALTLVNEAIEQGVSWDAGTAEALNLRGTFKFLLGNSTAARDDFVASVELVPTLTQSWVKLASVYMELNEPTKTFECFEEAIKYNKDDPDIFYHRGQVLFIMGEYQRAADDYSKSTALDSDFVFSHIQLAVAHYKLGDIAKSMATFRRTMKQFPQRSEPQNYYGELLLDQGRFAEAIEKFERAIELENDKPPPANVLPLVNKGLALFQFKQDIAAAEQCCQEALRIDSESDAAVATLAQLCLQQGKIDLAIEMLDRQAELARTEPELIGALSYKYASANQIEFMKNYPEMASQLGPIARGFTA